MVQFKDIFLGTDKPPYTRATNSQKCMRVAGKHNDLEDVGRDNTHHTFFEMLGNWSFGDYYKPEAIAWAWELLTKVWGLSKEHLWFTCFRDEYGEIPQDDEAANAWKEQPGVNPDHILFFGRKDNFWEMAETGPCGPCSEIHIDRGPQYCDKQNVPGHTCGVNQDCGRFLELWNLVFIQYNRINPSQLEALPAKHVDTGMGLERIVSVLQNVNSNYKTDLLSPMIQVVQKMTGQTDSERETNLTSYRVIADHARAAAFLIADGVIPGNTGRNYICRMIIRRAARFGGKIGLNKPFLANVAKEVIQNYGSFFPELKRNQTIITDALTREEERFHRTLESGLSRLDDLLDKIKSNQEKLLPGDEAFDLYATFGLPFEITRDIAREREMDVDEGGFHKAMEEHRLISGAGEAFGELGGEDVEIYRAVFEKLVQEGKLTPAGVCYDPYSNLEVSGEILALFKNGSAVQTAQVGDEIEILLPKTSFYIESGGQVSDTGSIVSVGELAWEIRVENMRKPAAGVIVHIGKVVKGNPKVGELAVAKVNTLRRQDIMRNHTATHLLHHQLRTILGEHARQAGSLVAPEKLRFDFTHPEALTDEQIERIENGVNQAILGNYILNTEYKPLQQAIAEGAIALFGEKYGEIVRNIQIGAPQVFSNELCGGTHVAETGDIGLFLITSESSAAAGIRRIEAVSGRAAYQLAHQRLKALHQTAKLLATPLEQVPNKTQHLLEELATTRKEAANLRQKMIEADFNLMLQNVDNIQGVTLLVVNVPGVDGDMLRHLVDRFREKYPLKSAIVLASIVNNHPLVVTAFSNDLAQAGLHAGELAKFIASFLGGSGGGKPTLAQAGGKDPKQLDLALSKIPEWISNKLK
jgi:alanyl-tRNA synthetase